MRAAPHGWRCPEPLREHFERAIKEGHGSDRIHERTRSQDELLVAATNLARSLGMDPEVGDLFGTAAVRCAKDRARRHAAWVGWDGEYRAALREAVQTVVDIGRVGIALQPDTAVRVLDGGRLASQFETRTSGGLYDPAIRAMGEWAAFGIHPSVPPALRPIYGFAFTPGRADQRSVAQYGCVRLVLRDEVVTRSTVTIGDSLNWHARPVAMRGFVGERAASDACARRGRADWGRILVEQGLTRYQDLCYVEAQVHGGVRTEDVDAIEVAQAPQSLPANTADRLQRAADSRDLPLRWHAVTP